MLWDLLKNQVFSRLLVFDGLVILHIYSENYKNTAAMRG